MGTIAGYKSGLCEGGVWIKMRAVRNSSGATGGLEILPRVVCPQWKRSGWAAPSAWPVRRRKWLPACFGGSELPFWSSGGHEYTPRPERAPDIFVPAIKTIFMATKNFIWPSNFYPRTEILLL